ncbi:MAG TPA: tRNA uridine-5-carboxymethylaminomethyl(34) synthesis GTPase MnmE [Aliidongia sp.]|uniref:tRNA uridine-5-carboxymethylaminomethyl(34) synthesis GTPase MnmE n=1 Tax=Aliidongia sp. TaxID=1914230 RepID=UPI002DDD8C14|nr:tRNA uridine-5-carboxymethylaminomethyl(34) synthesis GTPase MnmE [Aliidongia sp.]HEV2676872.1 tRNA uridine-5-carboxymethylaminomethyl(34) synthesis GTPase MnmE [Aliidongia sp.]
MTASRTIFAPATARGRAGVAVVRVSGPMAGLSLDMISGGIPAPRTARLAALMDPVTGETIDRGLVLWFPGPASFTGEDVAEFHVHGGPAVVAALLAALGEIEACRMAEPGEFTRRAFLNGKLDLTQAEGLGDLIAAETAAQRRQALGQMDGGFARIAEDWARQLTRTLAHVEAAIDFPDDDLPDDLLGPARMMAERLEREIRERLADGRRGEILRDGLSVALVGPPNSGKSSLMNALAGRDAAIVSAQAGTTRDVIEVHLDLGGYPVILADTAGIRDGADPIEAEGIRRARARAEAADLRLLVLDAGAPDSLEEFSALRGAATLVVWNKVDLNPEVGDGLAISAATGQGLGQLIEALAARAETLLAGDAPIVTRQRHRAALEECADCLARAIAGHDPALVGEDLRLAVRALGRITGRVDVEDLLDVIFRDFCIGK